jgi:hypothetical protein
LPKVVVLLPSSFPTFGLHIMVISNCHLHQHDVQRKWRRQH